MGEWLFRLGVWVWRRWRPEVGWLGWTLALIVAVWPGAALAATDWVRQYNSALVTTPLLAFLVAWWVAGRFSRRITGLIALSLTYPLILTTVGRVWPSPALWANGALHALAWAVTGGKVGSPLEAWGMWWAAFSWQWLTFHRELLMWAEAARQGTVVSGQLALTVLLALFLYATAWWAAWWVRAGNGLVASLPAVATCAWNAYLADRSLWWLVGALAWVPLLSAAIHHRTLERQWQHRGVDYSDQLALDFAMTGVLVAIGVFLLAPVPAALASPRLHAQVREWLQGPWRQVEAQSARLFPDVYRPAPSQETGHPDLPRSHKLGAGPELLDVEVMRVRPTGGSWPDHVYWFGRAYDVYTGHGWVASPWVPRALSPGEPWRPPDPALYRLVSHEVSLAQADDDVYAAGMPVAVNRPARALLRSDADLVGMELRSRTTNYTVLAAVPAWDEARLRAAEGPIPEAIRSRYLQLPDSLPRRLRDLAQEITRGETTPYGKARAIERFLREFPYSLDVPIPPAERDVVDWFLFDLQRGYCDYYASAFVVLARLNGLPARFIIGYAQGRWDPEAGVYVVTEREAHSWPEVYFPGVGWVPFEPTASRTVFRWEETTVSPAPTPSVEGLSEALDEFQRWATTRWRQGLLLAWLVRITVGLALSVAGAAGVVLLWWVRVPAPARPYALARRVGRFLGVPDNPALTPSEYAVLLVRGVERTWRRGATWIASRVPQAVRTYVEWRYGRRRH